MNYGRNEDYAFQMAKKNLLTGKLNLELKKRIMKATVWSIALYVAETWTIIQNHWKK